MDFDFSSSHPVMPGGRLEIVPGRDEIHLEGCGCFLLFQRECKGGQAFLLNRLGPQYYNLHTIGSIYREVRGESFVTTDKVATWLHPILNHILSGKMIL